MNELYRGFPISTTLSGEGACDTGVPVMVYIRLADLANVDEVQFEPLDGACSLSPRARACVTATLIP